MAVSQPAPPAPAKTSLSIATQRSAAQAVLGEELAAGLLTLIFAQGTSFNFDGPNVAPVCNNSTQVSSITGSGTITTTTDVFYDPACTTILAHVVLKETSIPVFSPGALLWGLDGTQTFTSRTGAVVAYNSLTGAATTRFSPFTVSFSVRGTATANPLAPAIGSFGLSCIATGSSKTCGFGATQNLSVPSCPAPSPPSCTALQAIEIGNTSTFNGTQIGNIVTGGTALEAYVSAPNAMTLSAPVNSNSTAWAIAGGGVPVLNDRGNLTIRTGAINLATTIATTLSDVQSDVSATATLPSGPFGDSNGFVTQISNGASASSFVLDGSGSGAILFSDGTVASVGGFLIR